MEEIYWIKAMTQSLASTPKNLKKQFFRIVIWQDNEVVDIFERDASSLQSVIRSAKRHLNQNRFGQFRIACFKKIDNKENLECVFDKVWTTKDALGI